MDQERTAIGSDRAGAAFGLRARAATAWSGLVAGLGMMKAHRPPPAPPAPRLAEHGQAGENRRDCRRCAADFDRAMGQVDSANLAKSRFIATVSHELRTPLNAIIGFSQIIRDDARRDGASPLHADFAQQIYDSGVHLMEIINEMLELANIESGRRTPCRETADVRQLLDGCLLAASASAEAAGVALSLEAAPDAVTTALIDRSMVKHIVTQLLSNAVKFTPAGGRIRLSLSRRDDRLTIAVRDTGVGIAAEDLGRVFLPFWQAAPTISRDYDGTGLGLTLVKAMAELQGGEVAIDSRPGEGTEVRVALPLRPAMNDGTVPAVSAA